MLLWIIYLFVYLFQELTSVLLTYCALLVLCMYVVVLCMCMISLSNVVLPVHVSVVEYKYYDNTFSSFFILFIYIP